MTRRRLAAVLALALGAGLLTTAPARLRVRAPRQLVRVLGGHY